MTSTHELNALLMEAVEDVRVACRELEQRSRDAAVADQAWREARARAFVQTEGTVAQREADVEIRTGDLRYKAKLAEDLRVSALEAGRSKRAIVSAFQSIASTARSEAELLKYADTGP